MWHSLTEKQISDLEDIDKIYLRRILNSHEKVALECIFYEVGLFPLKYEIMRRHLIYLWKLLNVQKSELIHRVFRSQDNSPHPGDFVRLVEKDKNTLNLELSNTEIEQLSKSRFKNIVTKKTEQYALTELNKLKEKHTKSLYLNSSSFKASQYLVDARFSRTESQTLFRLRSRTLNVKINFPKQNESDKHCRTCKLFPQNLEFKFNN